MEKGEAACKLLQQAGGRTGPAAALRGHLPPGRICRPRQLREDAGAAPGPFLTVLPGAVAGRRGSAVTAVPSTRRASDRPLGRRRAPGSGVGPEFTF